MDNQWKEEECGTCDFSFWIERGEEVDEGDTICEEARKGECRKNPPSTQHMYTYRDRYPRIHKDTSACSCWREKQEN